MKLKLKVEDQVKIFLTAIVVILMLSLAGGYFYYENNIKKSWFTPGVASVFNTQVSYQFYTSRSELDNLYEEARELLISYNNLFDRHNKYLINANDESQGYINNLYVINEIYGQNIELKIDESLADIIQLSITEGIKSNGSFNIAIGELADLWTYYINPSLERMEEDYDFDLASGELYCDNQKCQPSSEVIANILTCLPTNEELSQIITISEKSDGYYIRFDKYKDCEKVSLSLGGSAKGYALKKIGDYFNEKEYLSFFNATSSTYYSQYKDELLDINHAIIDPLNYGDFDYALSFKGKSQLSTSTSGDYQQGYYVKINNEWFRRHHIINPYSGYSDNYYRSISVYMNDPLLADILTTTLFNFELEEGYQLFKMYKSLYAELEVIWIENVSYDKIRVVATTGLFDKIVTKNNYEKVNVELLMEGVN